MAQDDHIKQLLQAGLDKFNINGELDNPDDPRTQAPVTVPNFEELGYRYESNPVLKKKVEAEIKALRIKDGID